MLEGLAPVAQVALGGELVEVRARQREADAGVVGDPLGDAGPRQLHAIVLDVAPAAELQPHDQRERLERRHLLEEAADAGLDQVLGSGRARHG